jgi:hypothetical protein
MSVARDVRAALASGTALNRAGSVVLGRAFEPRVPHRRRLMCYWCLERDGRIFCVRESAIAPCAERRCPEACLLAKKRSHDPETIRSRQQRSNRSGRSAGQLWRTASPAALLMIGAVANGVADIGPGGQPTQATPQSWQDGSGDRFSIHWQATYVEQETLGFNAPYSGPNSLSPYSGRETVDTTLFAGARLWSGAETWINPEIDQGFGLDDTHGVAAFSSGNAYKVGKNQPYLRLARWFVRQSVDLDDKLEETDGGANVFAGRRSPNRLVFTVGKFAVTDIFDTNQYAHDPRGDFLNWAVVDAGTFDYAADAWGYTAGAAAEWYQGPWTLRAGVFDLSNIPNSTHLDPGFHELEMDLELERRYEVHAQPGRVLLTVFDNRARMGLLDEAVSLAQATDTAVDIAAVRSYRSRSGASIGLEQALAPDLGLFARAGKADGNVEIYEYTDIDRTVSAGLSLGSSGRHNRSCARRRPHLRCP